MTKKEHVLAILQRIGLLPTIDEDGDVKVRYQLKDVYFMGEEDEDGGEGNHYVQTLMPQIYEMEEGEESLVLATCNKTVREVRFIKVFVDHSFKSVAATCEFYYTDDESLEKNIRESLRVLGVIHTIFYNNMSELSE